MDLQLPVVADRTQVAVAVQAACLRVHGAESSVAEKSVGAVRAADDYTVHVPVTAGGVGAAVTAAVEVAETANCPSWDDSPWSFAASRECRYVSR